MAGEPRNNKIKRIFSLTLLGVIALVAIIVANVVLWRNNESKQSQIDELNNEISQVHQGIAGTPPPSGDLESKLAAAQSELETAQNALPGNVNGNDVIDYIIGVAEECRVEVVPLVVRGWSPGETGDYYGVLKLSGTVTGSLENATDFMTRLQEGKYPSLVITGCSVQRIDQAELSSSVLNVPVIINISIAVYGSSPAAEGGV